MQINIFEIAGSVYAIPLSQTRELVRMPSIQPLPKSPSVIEGIVDLRGMVIAIFDLRRRFGLPERPPQPSDYLIVADAGPRVVGLRVDRVRGAARAAPEDIVRAASISPNTDYLLGIATLQDGLVFIHDLATFLDDAEARALDLALVAGTDA